MAVLIHQAVRNLSETLREAISLFYFEGYSVQEAACFLDIPVGTLKRRLYDGRRRLRKTAEQILKGTKPMNPQREQILRQLIAAEKKGLESEDFYQVMRQVFRLRPMPRDLIRKLMQRHLDTKRVKEPMSTEKENLLRERLSNIFRPSERAQDPTHPVGAVAEAIRAALPEFKQWQVDMSQVDVSQLARQMVEDKGLSFITPPGYAGELPVSYMSAKKAWLVQDRDGSVCTTYELMQRKDTKKTLATQMKQGSRISDCLHLLWKRLEVIELRAVEELLRRLVGAIVPKEAVRFFTYDDPRYRTSLRMQFGDNPIPAAIGGVHNPTQGLSDKVSAASVILYLEPWAAAQSGQLIELAEFPTVFFENNKN